MRWKVFKSSETASVQWLFANSTVFRCRLNMGSDVDAVTKSGRLFHTRAAATGNARSPTVDSRDGGSRWRGTVAQCHGDSGKCFD